MEYKTGSRWKSVVSDTQVVIVRSPNMPVSLGCGGSPMVGLDDEPPEGSALDPSLAEGTLIGKRYVDEETGIEVLCTQGGEGTLTVDDRVLQLQGAKPLPSSD